MAKMLVAAIAAMTLCGCTDAIQKLQVQFNRLDANVNDLRSFQAEQTSKITTLETQIRELSGRIDELEYGQKQKLGTIDTLKSDVSTLRKHVPPPPIVPAEPLEQDEASIGRLPSELAEPVGEGLQLLREGNFEKALSFWDDALYLGSGTEWAALALFWRGVALDGMNDNRKALENYHDLVSRFPKYARVPLVLMREASVLIRLGDSKTARLTLNKVIADFPRSPEAAQAKQRLKDL